MPAQVMALVMIEVVHSGMNELPFCTIHIYTRSVRLGKRGNE